MIKGASILQQTNLYYVIRTDHEGNYTYVNEFFRGDLVFWWKEMIFWAQIHSTLLHPKTIKFV